MSLLPPPPRAPSRGSKRNARGGVVWLLLATPLAFLTAVMIAGAALFGRDGLGIAVFMGLLMGGLAAFAFRRARARFQVAELHRRGLELTAIVSGRTVHVTSEGVARTLPLRREVEDLVPVAGVESGVLALATPDLSRVHLVAREEVDLPQLVPALPPEAAPTPARERIDVEQIRELAGSLRGVGMALPGLLAVGGASTLLNGRWIGLGAALLAAAGLIFLKEARLARRRRQLPEIGIVRRSRVVRLRRLAKAVLLSVEFTSGGRLVKGTCVVPIPWVPRTQGSELDVIVHPEHPGVWIPLCDPIAAPDS